MNSVDHNARRPAGVTLQQMRYQQVLLMLAFSGSVLVACRKDEAGTPPTVSIVAPYNGFDLSVPDTLMVVVDIGGQDRVDRVIATLSDGNSVPVVPSVSTVPVATPGRVTLALPLLSEALRSGQYHLSVEARSGDASARDYRTVDLLEAPLRLRNVVLVGAPMGNTVPISLIDSTGALHAVNNVVTDLAGAGISSSAQRFYLVGAVAGPLLAVAPNGLQVLWQQQNQSNNGLPWFTSLDVGADDRVYVGNTNGVLNGYNAHSGSTEFVAAINDGYRVLRCCVANGLVITVEQDVTATHQRVRLYQQSSGGFVAEQVLDKDVIAMFPRSDANVLLFGNRGSQGVVEDRSISGSGGWEPRSWNEHITAVEQVDGDHFLVALAGGGLERFTYSSASSLPLASGTPISDLAYDPVHGTVFAASGSLVRSLDPQSGAVLASWSAGSEVRYVLPLLNR